MPAVSKGTIELLTGSEGAHKARAQARAALVMGDGVVASATPPTDTRHDYAVDRAVAASELFVLGIVLDRKVAAGEAVDFCVRGEIEGFIGLTPGTFLSFRNGSLDTTAPDTGVDPVGDGAALPVPAARQFYVVSPTRLYKLF